MIAGSDSRLRRQRPPAPPVAAARRPDLPAGRILDGGGVCLVRAARRAALVLVQPNLFGGIDLVRPPVRRRGLRTVRPRRRVEHHVDLYELQEALLRELYRRARGGYVVEADARRRLRVLSGS